jgi:nucleotide-binding universal stress UspA family protein
MTDLVKTILVPIDGSVHARKALAFACDLARKYEARLIVLHVLIHKHVAEALRDIDTREGAVGDRGESLIAALGDRRLKEFFTRAPEPAGEPLRAVLEYIAKKVVGEAQDIARVHGVQPACLVVEDGDPAKRILEHAEKENADLIVMGSRGLSDLEGLLLGSTSHQVAHLARCTCVTVK